MAKETIAVGTRCPLCDGTFYVPEPKYSKMIRQLVHNITGLVEMLDDFHDRNGIDDDVWGELRERAVYAVEDLL